MPDQTRSRRLTRPAAGAGSSAPAAAPLPIASLLAGTARLIDLLPHLHQHAVDATNGRCTLLFEHNPRNGVLQATSGFGLDVLRTDPWIPGDGEAALVADAFTRRSPTLVIDAQRQMPDLASRLDTPGAILLPLARGTARIGLLAVGVAHTPNDRSISADAGDVADAFVTALELCRFRQRDELQRDLRDLLAEVSERLSATLNLGAGLDVLCHGACRLFGADRTSVWMHDRRARQLVLEASSDLAHVERGARVPSDDSLAPAACGMRRTRADIVWPESGGEDETGAATSVVAVPLRGRRRALGAIVLDGARIEPGGELEFLDRADELGRQLAAAIENMQLLDDVIRSRRELENTFDSIAHLVAVSDRRGRIVHVNRAFAARVGHTRDELVDRPIADFMGPELAAWMAEQETAARDTADTGATREVVDPVLHGPFVVTATDLLNQEQERVGSVIVARDTSPEAKIEAEREEMRRRLAQSEKLAALGQFVAGIAHELNNPLQGVLGHLELLRVTGAIPKPLRREIQGIYREADRAAKIVRNLLVFAGSRRLARRGVSLNGVLQKVVALRAAACRAQEIEVVRHYDEKLPRVQSDPLLLHQVFLNVLMNAEHAIASTGHGGRIEITTAVAPGGDRIVTTVRDTGPGIPVDALARVFEPFYTTKEVGKGTGLGLAIAYGIVLEHGGQIVAANHSSGGAVFTVELPAGKRSQGKDVQA
jgi:two-component system, NtrC family, sensor kinase